MVKVATKWSLCVTSAHWIQGTVREGRNCRSWHDLLLPFACDHQSTTLSPTQADLSVPLKEHTLFCHRHRNQYFIVLIDSSGKVRQQTEDLDDTKGMKGGMEMFTVMGSSFLVWVAYFDSFICSEWWHSFMAILYPMLWFIF